MSLSPSVQKQVDRVRALGAEVLPKLDAAKARVVERRVASGTTTATAELSCLWIGAHLALVHRPGRSAWSGMGQRSYYAQSVELVYVAGGACEFPHGVRAVLADLVEDESFARGDFWEGSSGKRLDAEVLQGLAARAQAIDACVDVAIARLDNERLIADREAEEIERNAKMEAEGLARLSARARELAAALTEAGIPAAASGADVKLAIPEAEALLGLARVTRNVPAFMAEAGARMREHCEEAHGGAYLPVSCVECGGGS